MAWIQLLSSIKTLYSSAKIRTTDTSASSQVKTVGVFVNESIETVHSIMATAHLDYAQLHGDEDPAYCQSLGFPWIKAFRVSDFSTLSIIPDYGPHLFLLDAYHPQEYGGSGKTFDWNIAEQAQRYGSFFLAGGLSPDNLSECLQQVQPYGVDICSGVESAPGIKMRSKIALCQSILQKTVFQSHY